MTNLYHIVYPSYHISAILKMGPLLGMFVEYTMRWKPWARGVQGLEGR